MPELPEVETVVRDLRPALLGRHVVSAVAGPKPLRRPWSPHQERRLVGRRFVELGRRGKWIIARLDAGALLIHLGMTGQLTVGDPARPVEPHTHFWLDLSDAAQLRFRDPRRFGSIDCFDDHARLAEFLDARLGPEPFALEPAGWRSALAGSRRCIKALLLDQAVVAGVGNIYADEALFRAKIAPTRPACALTPTEAERLRRAIAGVLTFAIERRGSSIRDYVGGAGQRGQFQQEFRAYGRAGEPCGRCGGAIARAWVAGRSSHYCPTCQAG